MKIPNYMYEPIPNFSRNGLAFAAKALRVEAKLARKQHCHPEFIRALNNAAHNLDMAAKENTCMATVFEWPDQQPVGKTEGKL